MMDDCWSNLPKELIELIASLLIIDVIDYVRFGAVCKSWRSVFLEMRPSHPPPQRPLFPDFCFFSPSHCKIISLIAVDTLELSCIGSSHGWLTMLDNESPNIFLLNPLTNAKIFLPPTTTLPWVLDYQPSRKVYVLLLKCAPDRYRELQICSCSLLTSLKLKTVLSSHPTLSNSNDNKCVVLMASEHMGQFLFCTPGDEKWTIIQEDTPFFLRGLHISYYNRQFYCVADVSHGKLSVGFELDSPSGGRMKQIASFNLLLAEMFYLVESFGELLLVTYSCSSHNSSDMIFKVYKFDQKSNELVEVESLGDVTLFVSVYNSFSLLASNYPGLEPNCIYCAEEEYFENCKVIFNLGKKSFKLLPSICPRGCIFSLPPNIWFTPSLW